MDYHCKAPFVLQFHGVFPSRRLVSSISSSRSRHTKSSGAATTEVAALSAMVFSCLGGAFFKAICWLKDVASSCSSRSRSSAAATTKVAAEQLPRAGNLCFLTRVSEGTLGLVDYHCRAPFRPSVPWCFPVREVHFFKAICWLKDVVNSCGLQRWQIGAKRCQELSRVGPCVL